MLNRVFKIKPGEGGRVLLLLMQNFFIASVTIAGKSARDTFFLTRYNKSYLPLMIVACAIAVALVSGAYSRLSSKMSRTSIFDLSMGLSAGLILLMQTHIEGWVIPALYVWMEVVVALCVMQMWLLASEVLDPRQAKRLYGLIGGGGSIAAILVGTGLKPFARAFGSQKLLWLTVGCIAMSWLFGRMSFRNAIVRVPSTAPNPLKKPAARRLDKYLLAIALLIGFSAIVSQVVDYQFKIIAARTYANESDLAGFFGLFYASTGLASLLVQFFLTAPVLTHFGVLAGLLALPVSLLFGSVAVVVSPKLLSGAFAKFSDQTFKFTLNTSSMELLWMPVSPERRRAMRPLITGTVKSAFEASAGLITFFLLKVIAFASLGYLSLGAIAGWLFVTFRLKPLYTKALVKAIDKEQINFEDLELNVQDPAMISIIQKSLEEGDETHRLFALRLIEPLPLQPWTKTLQELAKSGSTSVRSRIFALAAEEPRVISDAMVIEALTEINEVGLEATRVAGIRKLAAAIPRLTELLDHSDFELRAAAATAIIRIGGGPVDHAREALARLLKTLDPKARVAALRNLGDDRDLLPDDLLERFLLDEAYGVRLAGLEVASARHPEALLPAVLLNLEDPRTGMQARQTLRSYPAETVRAALGSALEAPTADVSRHIAIVRAMADYPHPSTVDLLIRAFNEQDSALSSEAALALLTIAKRTPVPEAALDAVSQTINALTNQAYRVNRLLKLLPSGESSFLLGDHLRNQNREIVPAILRLTALQSPDRPVELVIRILDAGDNTRIPLALELADSFLGRERRSILGPLLEPMPVQERDAFGSRRFEDLPSNLNDYLNGAVYSLRKWESAISVDFLRRDHRENVWQGIDWRKVPESDLKQEILSEKGAGSAMYSTLEKTIMLASVSLFQGIPAENLSRVAHIAEETHWPAGSSIFREGDFGESLFIVVQGTVRIHRKGKDLAILKKGDCVGEMAILDLAPRSADVSAAEDAILLKISQDDFYAVLSANPQIAQSIMRLLTRRLREANEKLTANS